MEKKAVLALFVVAPFVEACETLVGGDILEGVAGCLGKTIPPPGGKMLDAGGGGRERSIKESVTMMEIEINRFSIKIIHEIGWIFCSGPLLKKLYLKQLLLHMYIFYANFKGLLSTKMAQKIKSICGSICSCENFSI